MPGRGKTMSDTKPDPLSDFDREVLALLMDMMEAVPQDIIEAEFPEPSIYSGAGVKEGWDEQ